MPYTQSIARACQNFSHQPEHPSDLLIAPLIQLSELLCRVNDHFSYDNIEDSDIHGDINLEASTSNFSAELRRLRDAMPASIQENSTSTLKMLELMRLMSVYSHHSTCGRSDRGYDPRVLTSPHAMAAITRHYACHNKLYAELYASKVAGSFPDFCTYAPQRTLILASSLHVPKLVRVVLFDITSRESGSTSAYRNYRFSTRQSGVTCSRRLLSTRKWG